MLSLDFYVATAHSLMRLSRHQVGHGPLKDPLDVSMHRSSYFCYCRSAQGPTGNWQMALYSWRLPRNVLRAPTRQLTEPLSLSALRLALQQLGRRSTAGALHVWGERQQQHEKARRSHETTGGSHKFSPSVPSKSGIRVRGTRMAVGNVGGVRSFTGLPVSADVAMRPNQKTRNCCILTVTFARL